MFRRLFWPLLVAGAIVLLALAVPELVRVIAAHVGNVNSLRSPSRPGYSPPSAEDRACLDNLMAIDGAKCQWALMAGATNGTVVSAAQIDEFIKGGFASLRCARGGKYVVNPIGVSPSCSYAMDPDRVSSIHCLAPVADSATPALSVPSGVRPRK